MFNLLPKTRFSLVAKMSFTALFTALTILLLKLPAMFPGLGGIAFLRVSGSSFSLSKLLCFRGRNSSQSSFVFNI